MQLASIVCAFILMTQGINAACGPTITYCQGACICKPAGIQASLDDQCKQQGKKSNGPHEAKSGDNTICTHQCC
ncbi:uncharacterized protein CTRU02_201320 [Colletotrichum truncatum]|uniref:Uncharacterized protein n=1 Tax=Colletotrichum truncatum TaxID=5467 RepID=A0ACC3ZH03_COLTU|nr:uncharacterized protein CTRU02_08112 [Colletotrichum truncatum]KAF6790592.1 hypothetical protein CTRU02_08112 [Colletotrichum truncatum]